MMGEHPLTIQLLQEATRMAPPLTRADATIRRDQRSAAALWKRPGSTWGLHAVATQGGEGVGRGLVGA